MLERDNSLKATIHPKVDSGTQRRVQTSFKISIIEKELPDNIISKSTTDKPNLLRKKEITRRIKSSSRVRSKGQTKKKETTPKPKNITKKQLQDIISDAQPDGKKTPNFISSSNKNKDELEKVIIQEIEKDIQKMKDAVEKHRNKLQDSIVSPIFEIKETPSMESRINDEESELANIFSNLDIKESDVSPKKSSTPPVRSTRTIPIKKPSETKGSGRKTKKKITIKKKTK